VPAVIAAELAGTGWDNPPRLYLIGQHDGRCELHPFPLPGFLWDAMPLHQVIATTAAAAASALARHGARLDPDFAGAAVRFEAWDLPWPLLHGPALARAHADLALGRVHARPDRIECRYIFAAGLDGTCWEARQIRAQPLPRTATYPPGAPQPSDNARAYDALRFFTRTVLGPDGPVAGP